MTKVQSSNLQRAVRVHVLRLSLGAPGLEIALSEVCTGPAINGHLDGLIAPPHVDDVLVLIVNVLVQLSSPNLAPETEEEGQLPLTELKGKEIGHILYNGVRRRSLVQQQP